MYCEFENGECMVCGRKINSRHIPCEKINAICPVAEIQSSHGVGTEIHKLIKRYEIDITADCRCVNRINAMNNRGIAWCERSKKRIIDWLQEAASEQGIISYRTAVTLHTVGAWRHCVKVQLLQPAIAAAKLDPLAK